jgi:hypothetical protein
MQFVGVEATAERVRSMHEWTFDAVLQRHQDVPMARISGHHQDYQPQAEAGQTALYDQYANRNWCADVEDQFF